MEIYCTCISLNFIYLLRKITASHNKVTHRWLINIIKSKPYIYYGLMHTEKFQQYFIYFIILCFI